MKLAKVPLINGLGKTIGCEKTPDLIIENLKEIYSNEQEKFIDVNLMDIESFKVNNEDIEDSLNDLYDFAFKIFKSSHKSFFIGGDHSISYPLVRAFFDYCQSMEDGKIKEPCLIVFDAHPDLMPVAFDKAPSHEEWLRKLIEDGFPVENIILVGLRNSDKEELSFISKSKLKKISINSFLEDINEVCDSLMEFASKKELYVSIDIDVVDPGFAPGTGYLEPGGFSSRELIYLLQRINKMKSLRAIDLVEINAEKDKKYDFRTIKLGSKILGEFL